MEDFTNSYNMNGMSYPNGYPNGMDLNDMYKDPMFNPITQYEQGYTYYKFLCKQMEYKIKCKEYDKLCGESNNRNSSTTNQNKS